MAMILSEEQIMLKDSAKTFVLLTRRLLSFASFETLKMLRVSMRILGPPW